MLTSIMAPADLGALIRKDLEDLEIQDRIWAFIEDLLTFANYQEEEAERQAEAFEEIINGDDRCLFCDDEPCSCDDYEDEVDYDDD